eukprot:3619390-Pyramimonas_sp.AAC.1
MPQSEFGCAGGKGVEFYRWVCRLRVLLAEPCLPFDVAVFPERGGVNLSAQVLRDHERDVLGQFLE